MSRSAQGSMPIDRYSESEWFLTTLDGRTNKFVFCAFDERDGNRRPVVIHSDFDSCSDRLNSLNQDGYGIFVCVNKTEGARRRKGDVVEIRALWQEQDKPDYPDLPIEPHMVVETSPGKHHRYILVENASLEEFESVQERLVEDYGSDPNAKDRSRVLRLPGFYNNKDPQNPFLVRLVDNPQTKPRMDWSVVKEYLPPVVVEKRQNPSKNEIPNEKKILSALKSISPDIGYQGWLEIGMALHAEFEGSERGLAIWDVWSIGSEKDKYQPGVCYYKWQSFQGEGVTIGTLFKKARDNGWMWDDQGADVAESDNSKKQSVTQTMIELVRECSALVHDSEDKTYAIVIRDGHQELLPLESDQFSKFAQRLVFEKIGRVVNAMAFRDALNVLTGQALYDGELVKVNFRVAKNGNAYFIDLGQSDWKVAKITSAGWEIVESSRDVFFYRTTAMMPLPEPERCSFKDLPKLLSHHFNLDEQQLYLLIAYLLSALMPDTEYPILEITGPPGSGKSTVQEQIRLMLDPNLANLRIAPKCLDDIPIGAINNYVVSYNNMSKISNAQSDVLCSLSTGGGYSSRTLYTNTGETVANIQRPVIINGVDDLAKQPDLLDRVVKIVLHPIPSGKNRPKKQMKEDFLNDLPALLGALWNLLGKSIEVLPDIKIDNLPRMADFGLLCEAVSLVYDRKIDVLKAYIGNREDLLISALETSPTIMAVVKFMDGRNSYEGTVGDLYEEIKKYQINNDGWVKSARGLGGKLRMHLPALKAMGLNISFDPARRNDGYHLTISKKKDVYTQRSPLRVLRPSSPANRERGERRERREHSYQVLIGKSGGWQEGDV